MAERIGAGGCIWLLVVLMATAPAFAAEVRAVPWEGERFAPGIPDSRTVLGHDFGERISDPDQVARYLQALHAAAPERTRLVEYARSWQGRPLHYLVIGRAETIARLDEIKAGMRQLADPRNLNRQQLDRLLDELPAIVWLAHGVHGDEISSSDAALLTAYYLLAVEDRLGGRDLEIAPTGGLGRDLEIAPTGGLVAGGDTLVVIDPLQNPDGRARFVHHYQSLAGLGPAPSPMAAERSQRWPSGRGNHYLFDMNRDWFAQTQPEVRGRVQAFLEFFPTVYVDLHEMGTDSSYYFPPPAVPHNPYLDAAQLASFEVFGQHIGARFDALGYRYFTREIFDAYYPGYGDSWPTLHGALGMTFETASARGLAGRDAHGRVVTYLDGVQRHFVASIATIETAARERRALLEAFVQHRHGPAERQAYLLPLTADGAGHPAGRVARLAGLLARQGVEVRRLPRAERLCGQQLPAGSYAVTTHQPAGRLAATLLAPESPADPAFWAEQERLAAKRLPQQVYDIVAWSLPQLFDVEVIDCNVSVAGYPLAEDFDLPVAPPAPARVAYLVPWGSQAAARFLAGALRAGIEVEFTRRAFMQGDVTYPAGSLILRVTANANDLHEQVTALAAATGADVRATATSWATNGIDLGSDQVRRIRPPRIALGWGRPASTLSAGALRYTVERKLDYPVVPVWMEQLGSEELRGFDVLVLPDGGDYAAVLDDTITANIDAWVRQGGTLIGIGAAVGYLGQDDAELLSTRLERRAGSAGAAAPDAGADDADAGEAPPSRGAPGVILDTEADLQQAITPEDEPPASIHGILVNANADPDHWLAAGLGSRARFMLQGDRVFTPLRLDQGVNVMTFAAGDSLVAGGFASAATLEQLQRKPLVMVQPQGRGIVIGFAADPGFRGMLDGLDVLIANAVFFGPAHASPIPGARP